MNNNNIILQQLHRSILFSIYNNPTRKTTKYQFLQQLEILNDENYKTRMASAFDELISEQYLIKCSGYDILSAFKLSNKGLRTAQHVHDELAKENLDGERESFDLIIQTTKLRRVAILPDGNCLHRSICEALGFGQEKYMDLKRAAFSFMNANDGFVSVIWNEMRGQEGEVENSDFKDFNEWKQLNKKDKRYDSYGTIFLLIYMMMFNIVITIVNEKNEPIYPAEGREQAIYGFITGWLQSNQKQDHQMVNLLLLSRSCHYESLKSIEIASACDVTKCTV